MQNWSEPPSRENGSRAEYVLTLFAVQSTMTVPGGPTCRSSRPLRARDRWFFGTLPCSALAAAERHTVGRLSIIQLSRSSTPLYAALAPEQRAVPILAIERGMQADCAGCGSV